MALLGAVRLPWSDDLQEKLSQDDRYIVKLLISPNLKSSNAFLRLILETFDVKTERSYTASLQNFEQFLIQQYQEGKVPVSTD